MTWEQQLQFALQRIDAQTPADTARAARMEAAFLAHISLVAKVRLVLFGIVFAVSFAAFIYTGLDAISEAGRAGFTDVLHLALSDWSLVLAQWQSFMLSLIELLPALSLTGVLLGFAGMLVSLGYISSYGKRLYLKNV